MFQILKALINSISGRTCSHCRKIGESLGTCRNCGEPVCEKCGRSPKVDSAFHFDMWCYKKKKKDQQSYSSDIYAGSKTEYE